MPMYTYECPKCGVTFETFRRMDDRKSAKCKCGNMGRQIISRIAGTSVFDGYFEHITSEPVNVSNKKELKEVCRRHGCYAPGVLD